MSFKNSFIFLRQEVDVTTSSPNKIKQTISRINYLFPGFDIPSIHFSCQMFLLFVVLLFQLFFP